MTLLSSLEKDLNEVRADFYTPDVLGLEERAGQLAGVALRVV